MLSLREAYTSAKSRVNPEGLAVSLSLAYASAVMIPFQAALTYAIDEVSKGVSTDAVKLATIGLLAVENGVSVAIEARTLKEDNYSASPTASILNIATGKPVVASTIGHVLNHTQNIIVNPVNAVNIASAYSGDNGRFFFENVAAIATGLGIWNIGCNELILHGKIDPLTNGIKKIREATVKVFKKDNNNTAE